jgi:VIT1/CCC1 family predicted Fe2+/Mn2+ transporter
MDAAKKDVATKAHAELHTLGALGSGVRDIVFGVHDGILTVLGFASGAAGIFADSRTIFFTGLAGMIAEGISMGIGEYQAIKAQNEIMEHQRHIEEEEVRTKPQEELQEVCDIYCKKGFSKKEAMRIARRIAKDKKRWVDTMMTEELGFSPNGGENPIQDALTIGVASFVGGFIPLVGYLFLAKEDAFMASVGLSAIVVFFLGVLKERYAEHRWLSSGLKMMAVALLTALLTFYIGKFLGSIYAGM